RRASGFADPEREVTGLAAHGDHQVPARRRARVDHQVLDDVDAEVARRLIAEGDHALREVQVVVDRLGHVDHAEPAVRVVGQAHGRVGRVAAPDGDQVVDTELLEGRDGGFEVARV